MQYRCPRDLDVCFWNHGVHARKFSVEASGNTPRTLTLPGGRPFGILKGMATQQPTRRASRLRRWVKRGVGWAGLTVALTTVSLLVLVHNLDRPWVKRRVQAVVFQKLGVAIDYRAVCVSVLSGATIDDLVVASPSKVKSAAPELLRVGRLTGRWSWAGTGPPIEAVTLSDVAITVVVDENGRTSFDALPSSGPSTPTPLSQRTRGLFGSPLPLSHFDAQRVSIAFVRTEHDVEVERFLARGIELAVTSDVVPSGAAVLARLGNTAAPLSVEIERRGSAVANAHIRLSATLRATASEIAGAIDVEVVDQDLVAGVHVKHALSAHGRAHFDEAGKRTDVTLDADVADGSAHGTEASLTIPDDGPIVLASAVGDLDAARALAAAPGMFPTSAARAQLRYRIAGLLLATPPRLAEGGFATIDGDLLDARLQSDGRDALDIGAAALAVKARPDGGSGTAIHASLALDRVVVPLSGREVKLDGGKVDVDGHQDHDGTIDGEATVEVASCALLAVIAGRGLHAALKATHLHLGDPPLTSSGEMTVSGSVASLDVHAPGPRTLADAVSFRLDAALSGHTPYAGHGAVSATRLRILDRAGRALADGATHAEVRVTNVVPDMSVPIASTGIVHALAALGDVTATVDATKEERDAVDFKVVAHAATLTQTRSLVSGDLARMVPLDQMAVAVESSGRVARISSSLPELRQRTKLDVDQPAYGLLAARSMTVTVDSNGTAMRHSADIDLRAQALTFLGANASDDHIKVSGTVDRAELGARVVAELDGRASSKIAASASFDRGRRALVYDVEGQLSHLEPLRPLLARTLVGLDLTDLEVGVNAKGELFGMISDLTSAGQMQLAPNPSLTAAASGTVDVRFGHVRYSRGAFELGAPSATLHADLHTSSGRRSFETHLVVPSVHLSAGRHVIDVDGLEDDIAGTVTGDLRNPNAVVKQQVAVRTVQQDVLPTYPIGGVSLDLSARREAHAGVVNLDSLHFTNGSGGTSLTVAGNLDISDMRRTLALHGKLEQDVARVTNDPTAFVGRGKLTLAMRVESADLIVFDTRADVRADGVDARWPQSGVSIEAADGEIPIGIAVQLASTGVTMLRDTHASPYTMLRFADQHPLLTRRSFIAIHSITSPFGSIAPFVANVQVDRNIVAIQQFEMGVRQGRVSGACALDWAGEDSTLDLHVRATGVLSSHGEPFDGNAAVLISAGERSIDGRAEILRIGKRHLLDLLDLEDPLHADASMNRVRSGLSLGYPDHVRLVFDHGFASAHIELGGLGSLVSIGELRGLPMGPMIDRLLLPLSRRRP